MTLSNAAAWRMTVIQILFCNLLATAFELVDPINWLSTQIS